MNEKQIEAKLVQGVRANGGLCFKFISPGNAGVPDRIIIAPGGRVYFVELKTERGRPSEIQKRVMREMQKRGADVRLVKGLIAVEQFLEEMFSAKV